MIETLYRSMARVRALEDTLLRLSKEGHLRGSLHLARGQEAVSAGVGAVLHAHDSLTVTYRGHGFALTKGLDPQTMIAEILGKSGGLCGGFGGKMHLIDLDKGLLGANGIVGAAVPIAAGGALAAQIVEDGSIAATVFGDGAMNQGVVMETFNIASLMKLPLLLICENNLYSEMTPIERSTSVTNLCEKAKGFGIDSVRVDGNDVLQVYKTVSECAERARSGAGPVFIECMTYRISGHYHLDPGTGYRSKEEVEEWAWKDPLLRLRATHPELASAFDLADLEAETEIAEAADWALSQPEPNPERILDKVFV